MSEGNGNPDPLSYLIGKTLPNIINSQYPEGLDNAEMRRQFIEAALDIFNKIGLTGINATGLYTTLFPNNRSDVESSNTELKLEFDDDRIFDNGDPDDKLNNKIMEIYGDQPYAYSAMLDLFDSIMVPTLFVNKGNTVLISDIPANIYQLKLQLANDIIKFIAEDKEGYSYSTKIGDKTIADIYMPFRNGLVRLKSSKDDNFKMALLTKNTLKTQIIEDLFNAAFDNPGNRISELAQSTNDRDKEIFKMYNKLFILNNMDGLINRVYENIFDESKNTSSMEIAYHEYDMKKLNNLSKSWHDEDKEISAIHQAGNITRSIINTFTYYDFKTKQPYSAKLGWSRFNGAIGLLKGLVNTDLANFAVSSGEYPIGGVLGDFIANLNGGGAKAYKKLFDFLMQGKYDAYGKSTGRTVLEIISDTMFPSEIAGERQYGNDGMKESFKNSIYSIYREMFDDNADTGGMMLYKAYSDHIKNYDVPNYFEMISHYMGSVNRIDFTYISEDYKESGMKVRLLNSRALEQTKKRISARIYDMIDSLDIQVIEKMKAMMQNAGIDINKYPPSIEVSTRMVDSNKDKGEMTIRYRNFFFPPVGKPDNPLDYLFDGEYKVHRITSNLDDFNIVQSTGNKSTLASFVKGKRQDARYEDIANNNPGAALELLTMDSSDDTKKSTLDELLHIISQTDLVNNVDLRKQFKSNVGLGDNIAAILTITGFSYVNRTMVTGKIASKEELQSFMNRYFTSGIANEGGIANALPTITGISINPISSGLNGWEDALTNSIGIYENSTLRDTVKYGGKQFSVSQFQRLLTDTGRQYRRIRKEEDAAASGSLVHYGFREISNELGSLRSVISRGDNYWEYFDNKEVFGPTVVERLADIGEGKPRIEFNVNECLFSDFAIGFLDGYYMDKSSNPYTNFTFTVDSDKSTIHKPGVNTEFIAMLKKLSEYAPTDDAGIAALADFDKRMGISPQEMESIPYSLRGNYRVVKLLSKGLYNTYNKLVENVKTDIGRLNNLIGRVDDDFLNNKAFSHKDKAVLSLLKETLDANPKSTIVQIRDNYKGFNSLISNLSTRLSAMGYGDITPYEAMMILVKAYNTTRAIGEKEMKLVDQTHLVSDKRGNISFKRMFIDQLYRYNPDAYKKNKNGEFTLSRSTKQPVRLTASEVAMRHGFDPKAFDTHGVDANGNPIPGLTIDEYCTSFRDFFMQKNEELMFYAMQNNTQIFMNDSWKKPLTQGLGKFMADSKNKIWVKGNSMVLFKVVDQKGNVYDIANAADIRRFGLTRNGLNDYEVFKTFMDNMQMVHVNPVLLNFNYMDFFLGENYKINTVGGMFNHPIKSNGTLTGLEEEALGIIAQNKRNVSYTASVDQVLTNTLTGMGSTMNVCCVEDITDDVSSMSGNSNTIKPHDGICHISPVMAYWMLNSTGDSKVGMDMKPFLHSYDARTASGIIIKSSFNSLTNDGVRKGQNVENMIYKTMAAEWRDEQGRPITGNIFQDYNINRFSSDGKQMLNLFDYLSRKYNPMFETSEGIFEIVGIDAVMNPDTGRYQYFRKIARVDGAGNYNPDEVIEEGVAFDVNSNYDLWVLFGKENSREYDKKLNKIVPSENSIRMIVDLGNNVGLDRNGNKFTNSNTPYSQNECYQFMKHGNADLIVSNGAIKQGYANVNRVYDVIGNKDGLPSTFAIRTDYFGIQLDPTHTANNSRVSELSQVLSSLSSMGFSSDDADAIYKALGVVAKSSLQSMVKGIGYTSTANMEFKDYRKLIANIIVKAMSEAKALSDIERAKCADLIKRVEDGEYIEYEDLAEKLTLNDANFVSKVLPNIASYVNKISIRKQFPGSLSLLKAGYRIVNLYDGLSWEDLGFTPEEKIRKAMSIQEEYDIYRFKDVSECRMGFRYKLTMPVGSIDSETAKKLGRFEHFNDGVDETYYIELKDYSTYAKLKHVMNALATRYKDEPDVDYGLSEYIVRPADALETRIGGGIDFDGVRYIIEGRELAPMDIHFNIMEDGAVMHYNMYDTDAVRLLFKLKNKDEEFDKDDIEIINNIMIPTLRSSGKYYINEYTDRELLLRMFYQYEMNELDKVYKGGEGYIYINGVRKRVSSSGMRIYNYEAVTPNINASKFGLDQYTKLDDVTQESFALKMLDKWDLRVDANLYSYALMFDNGQHVYLHDANISGVMTEEDYQREGFELMTMGSKLAKDFEKASKNHYIYKRNGNDVFRISNQDKVYVDKRGNMIIDIVIKNGPGNINRKHLEKSDGYSDILSTARQMEFVVSPAVFDKDNGQEEVTNYLQMVINANAFVYDNDNKRIGGNKSMQFLKHDNFDELENAIIDAWDIAQVAEGVTREKINNALNEKKRDAIRILTTVGAEGLKNAKNSVFLQKVYWRSFGKYNSFLQTLKTVSARIPSQTMQSFMGMNTVLFDNTGFNSCFVNDMQLWLQGSDFDGDKVTFQEYAVDYNGHIIGWSPYFNDIQLDASLKLPFPTNVQANMAEPVNNVTQVMNTEQGLLFSAVFELNEEKTQYVMKNKDVNAIRALIESFNSQIENNGGILYYKEPKGTVRGINAYGKVLEFINAHNMYFDDTSEKKNEGLKNFITYKEYEIISNPVNMYEAQSSIDDFDMVKNEGANDKAGNMRNKQNVANVFTKLMAFRDNAIGKQVVSATAASIKNFYGLTQYFNTIGHNLSDNKVAELSEEVNINEAIKTLAKPILGKDHNGVVIGNKTYYTFVNFNPNKKYRAILNAHIGRIVNKIQESLNAVPHTPEEREKIFYQIMSGMNEARLTAKNNNIQLSDAEWKVVDIYSYINRSDAQVDAALILSALLTEATDNAKNLTLAKINAIPELISIYVFGISTGMDFAKIASYARSNTAHIFNELKQGNVFYGSVNNNFSFAKLKSTIVDPWHYVGEGRKIINDGDFHKMTDYAKDIFGYNDAAAAKRYRSLIPGNREFMKILIEGRSVSVSMRDVWTYYISNGLRMPEFWQNAGVTDEMIINKLRHFSYDLFGLLPADENGHRKPVDEKSDFYKDYKSMNAWIDRVEEIINIRKDINSEYETYFDKDNNEKRMTYLDVLIDMESGASEMMSSSKYMSKNKGVAGTLDKQESWLHAISNIISPSVIYNDKTSDFVKSFFADYSTGNPYDDEIKYGSTIIRKNGRKFNLHRFLTDPEYAEKAIQVYAETKMYAFNVLDVANSLPHINSYTWVQDLMVNMVENMSSTNKAASMITKAVSDVSGKLSQKEVKQLTNNVMRYIDLMVFDLFLRTYYGENQSFTFWVPENFEIFKAGTINGTFLRETTKKPLEISLGTTEGKMTFLKWMNEIVVPSYRQGRYDETQPKNRVLFMNDFIKGIVGTRVDKTLTGGIVPTSRVTDNRMSNDDFDIRNVQKFQIWANTLHNSKYINKTDGSKPSREFDMATLLFIADQLVFNGTNAEASLNYYFNSNNNPMKRQYYEFIDKYFCDDNGNFMPEKVTALLPNNDVELGSVAKSLAPTGSTYSSDAKYIRAFNKKTGLVETYEKKPEKDISVSTGKTEKGSFDEENGFADDMFNDIVQNAIEEDVVDWESDYDYDERRSYGGKGFNDSRYDKAASHQAYDIFIDGTIKTDNANLSKKQIEKMNKEEKTMEVNPINNIKNAQQATPVAAQNMSYGEFVSAVFTEGATSYATLKGLFDGNIQLGEEIYSTETGDSNVRKIQQDKMTYGRIIKGMQNSNAYGAIVMSNRNPTAVVSYLGKDGNPVTKIIKPTGGNKMRSVLTSLFSRKPSEMSNFVDQQSKEC